LSAGGSEMDGLNSEGDSVCSESSGGGESVSFGLGWVDRRFWRCWSK
jgi:hypothetical protein